MSTTCAGVIVYICTHYLSVNLSADSSINSHVESTKLVTIFGSLTNNRDNNTMDTQQNRIRNKTIAWGVHRGLCVVLNSSRKQMLITCITYSIRLSIREGVNVFRRTVKMEKYAPPSAYG